MFGCEFDLFMYRSMGERGWVRDRSENGEEQRSVTEESRIENGVERIESSREKKSRAMTGRMACAPAVARLRVGERTMIKK